MKKLVSFATVLAVVGTLGAGAANGQTIAELQAQIAQLTALLAQLQGGTAPAGGSIAACAGITAFTSNMTVGSTGQSVKCLQAILNSDTATKVATTGAGSPGMETTYFGGLTKTAVEKFQAKYSISPVAGFVGPLTRAKLNPMLAGGVTPPVVPGTPSTCTTATEGTYTVTISPSPVSRTVTGGTGLEAYGVDVKAYNSDIRVGKLDLQVSVTNASTSAVQDPGTFINAIKVYDTSTSGTLLATVSSPKFTLDSSSVYYTSITGFNLNVPVGTTKKLLVVVDTAASTDNNRTVVFNVYGNGIRGRDCANIDAFTALTTTRTLTIQPATTGTLTVTAASDNPDSNNLKSDASTGVQTNETVLSLNAKATAGSGTLTRMDVGYTTGNSQAIPSIMYLYQGDTLVQSCTPGARENGICTFETFEMPVAQNETKSMKVKANWATQDSGNTVFVANIPATSTHSVFMTGGGLTSNTTVSSQINANAQFVYELGVKLTPGTFTATVVASSIAGQPDVATGVLTFQVKPFGGSLSQIQYASGATGSVDLVRVECWYASGTECAASSTDATLSRTTAQSPVRNLVEDETGTVTTTMTLGQTTSTRSGVQVRFKIEQICYDVNADATDRCQGNGNGGNITDNWYTNWVYMP